MNLRNKKPIFIVAFARGGSNILLNILRSHPEVCSPRGETHEVFRGKGNERPLDLLVKRLRYLPIMLAQGGDIFSPRLWEARRPLRALSVRQIDHVLFHDKSRARGPSQNRWKAEGVAYTRDEIENSRLLCKNLNGLVFLSPHLARMYPDATFLALVRNGLAVCEGHARRGHDLLAFAPRYHAGCQEMIRQSETLARYHVLRYEDVIRDARAAMKQLYELTDLEPSVVRKVRLETKGVMGPDGRYTYTAGASEKTLVWYDVAEMQAHFTPDANENQIARLTAEQRAAIIDRCAPSLERFGYL